MACTLVAGPQVLGLAGQDKQKVGDTLVAELQVIVLRVGQELVQ